MTIAEVTNTQIISPTATPPCMRPREASTRCVTGFSLTTVWSLAGIVARSTKMLLTNVTGKSRQKLIVMTDSGFSTVNPTTIQIQDKLNAKGRCVHTYRVES